MFKKILLFARAMFLPLVVALLVGQNIWLFIASFVLLLAISPHSRQLFLTSRKVSEDGPSTQFLSRHDLHFLFPIALVAHNFAIARYGTPMMGPFNEITIGLSEYFPVVMKCIDTHKLTGKDAAIVGHIYVWSWAASILYFVAFLWFIRKSFRTGPKTFLQKYANNISGRFVYVYPFLLLFLSFCLFYEYWIGAIYGNEIEECPIDAFPFAPGRIALFIIAAFGFVILSIFTTIAIVVRLNTRSDKS